MNEATNYFLWISGAEHGPYTIEQIRTAVADGTIDAHQTARTEGGTDWKPLDQIARVAAPKPAKPATPAAKPTAAASTPATTTKPTSAATPTAASSSGSSSAVTTGFVGVAILSFLAWKLTAIERLLDKKETKPQFEYMVAAPKDYLFDSQMNALGAQGWEVVSARRATSSNEYDRSASYEVILKRQIR